MRVVNVREAGGWAAFVALRGIYLGRSRHLGNPFTVGVHGCRPCVLEQYRDWLFRQLTAPNRTVQMALSRLPPDAVIGCSAWRHPCHCCCVRLAYLWWAREGHRLYGGIRADLQQAWTRRGEAGSMVEPQESGPAALACPGPGNRWIGAIEMEATKPRAEKHPRKFSITFLIGGTRYWVVPNPGADLSVALTAYRFLKRDASNKVVASHDVRLTPEGRVECDCRGHCRWGHCRHQETLQAAGMLPS
jgi:hypothetical protein